MKGSRASGHRQRPQEPGQSRREAGGAGRRWDGVQGQCTESGHAPGAREQRAPKEAGSQDWSPRSRKSVRSGGQWGVLVLLSETAVVWLQHSKT